MTSLKLLVVSLTMLSTVTVVPLASGAPILSNLTEQTGTVSTKSELTLAVEFKTNAAPQLLTSATFILAATGGTTVSASLHAFDATQPQSPGALLESLVAPTISTTRMANTFTSPVPFLLVPETLYWVELVATPGAFKTDFGTAPTGFGAVYVADFYDNDFFAEFADVPLLQLDATPAVAVDEPQTSGLLVAATLVAAVLRRRRLSSTSAL